MKYKISYSKNGHIWEHAATFENAYEAGHYITRHIADYNTFHIKCEPVKMEAQRHETGVLS
ncbi:MAG: hypothetical protein OXG15_10145 [Gammaproteobacteria bacterium]|nr:hypothetical protein [Gammaproteobacteria bacterium]